MNKIFRYAGNYRKKTILALCVLTVSVFCGVVPYFFLYRLLEPLLRHQAVTFGSLFVWIALIGLFVLLSMVLYAVGLLFSHEGAYGTLKNLRVSLQQRLEKLPLGIIQDIGNGRIRKLFTDDIDSIELLLAHQIPEGISNLIVALVMLAAIAVVDVRLFLLYLAAFALACVIMSVTGKIGYSRMNAYYEAGAKMNNTIIEYINGMEVVKVFNRDGDSYKKFREDVMNYRDFTLAWYKACWPWMAIYFGILPCLCVFALPGGISFFLDGRLELANLALVLCLGLGLTAPLLKVSTQFSSIPQVGYKLDELEKVLDAESLKCGNGSFQGNNRDIVFDHVSFAYRDAEVIHNISMEIRDGCTTAFVGASGSGKSTLAKLLVHFYDVTGGRILIGGQDITGLGIDSLNDQISFVSQEQYLFNTSVYENIRIGNPNATEADILAAAEKAQCMDFISRLPQGIHSGVGDSGKALSGGERQRVALARAILKDAPIVILDEATAFMDPENEEKMDRAIAEVIKSKTLIVIAHRLQSIMNADRIFVLKDGALEAGGTHDELMETCEEYRRLWASSEASANWKISGEVS